MRLNCKLLTAIAIVCTANPAYAQIGSWRTQGLFAGAHIVAIHQPANGSAVGGLVGAGLTKNFSVLLAVDVGAVEVRDTMRMIAHADLALRAYPLTARMIAPFAEISFSAKGIENASDDMLTNTAFTWGVGAEWFYKTTRSVIAHLKRTELPAGPTYRLVLGVQLRPPRPNE